MAPRARREPEGFVKACRTVINLDAGADQHSEGGFRFTRYHWPDPSKIKPRDWLLGRWLLAGELTLIIAPGGVGKSTFCTGIALSVATGQPILYREVWPGAVPVAMLSLEDDATELHRSISAAAKHHGIDPSDCSDHLFINGIDQRLQLAFNSTEGVQIDDGLLDTLRAQIVRNGIRALIIDPFVSAHSVSENDNRAINEIATRLKQLATETGCAIAIVHHSRKSNGEALSAESGRGASALANAARIVLTLNRITARDAAKWDIPADQHRLYFSVSDDKANRSRPEGDTWFRLCSVSLGNGDAVHRFGDDVGAVEPWQPPSNNPVDDIDDFSTIAVQQAIAGGKWRESVQCSNWAGHAVAHALGLDPVQDKRRIAALIRYWLGSGALRIEKRPDAKRMLRDFVVVNGPVS